jgi:hypothetical protein
VTSLVMLTVLARFARANALLSKNGGWQAQAGYVGCARKLTGNRLSGELCAGTIG